VQQANDGTGEEQSSERGVQVVAAFACCVTRDQLTNDFERQQQLRRSSLGCRKTGASYLKKIGVSMSTRSLSIATALAGLLALTATGADAKPHSDQQSATGDRPAIAKNFTGKTKTYARTGKGKRQAKYGKSRRTASKKGLKSRSLTSYASGGTSRSCLQPQARALLNRIESQFGSVSIVSTCRAGAVIATSGKPSKHRYGMAIDFDAGSRKGAIVNWLIKNHHSGGTMTYRDMSHIHVDIGSRFVSLGANSGRG
jgi:uncharacterized protein YcbK (DUF882 family)